jgi:hypothetical protein
MERRAGQRGATQPSLLRPLDSARGRQGFPRRRGFPLRRGYGDEMGDKSGDKGEEGGLAAGTAALPGQGGTGKLPSMGSASMTERDPFDAAQDRPFVPLRSTQ